MDEQNDTNTSEANNEIATNNFKDAVTVHNGHGDEDGNIEMIETIKIENDIFEALQMARTNPLQMAKEIFTRMNDNFDKDGRLHFDWGIVETKQGKAAYENAIVFLTKRQPQKSLIYSNGIHNAIHEHVNKLIDEHQHLEAEDIEKHGIAVGNIIEVVEYGPWRSGLDWVIAFLVDDGDIHDKHREHLFSSNFKHCAIGLSKHNTYGNVCVISFAEKFIELESENGVIESRLDILNRHAIVLQRFWRRLNEKSGSSLIKKKKRLKRKKRKETKRKMNTDSKSEDEQKRHENEDNKHSDSNMNDSITSTSSFETDSEADAADSKLKLDGATMINIFKRGSPKGRKSIKRKGSIVLMNEEYENQLEQGKKKISERVVVFSYFLLVLEFLVELLTGVQYDEICIAINTYLLILVWIDTLRDEKRNIQLVRKMCVSIMLSSYLHFFGNIDRLTVILWCRYFFGFPAIVFMMYKVLHEVAHTLRNSERNLKELVTSTTSQLFHGIPLLLYFVTEVFSSEHSRNAIVMVLCQYMPGAIFEKDSQMPMSLHKGEWKNCTTPEKLSNLRPQHVVTGSETMLELYIVNFVSNELAHKVASFRALEVSVMTITVQVFRNLCSIHMEDVVAMQVSKEELTLWLLTALRTTCVLMIGAINVNYMTYQASSTITTYIEIVVSILYLLCFGVMMVIVREAQKVRHMEQSKNSDLIFANTATKQERLIHLRHTHESAPGRQQDSNYKTGFMTDSMMG